MRGDRVRPRASERMPGVPSDHRSSRMRDRAFSQAREMPHNRHELTKLAGGRSNLLQPLDKIWSMIMKTIVSALVALSVLTGVAASANAFDAKSFYEQQERQSH